MWTTECKQNENCESQLVPAGRESRSILRPTVSPDRCLNRRMDGMMLCALDADVGRALPRRDPPQERRVSRSAEEVADDVSSQAAKTLVRPLFRLEVFTCVVLTISRSAPPVSPSSCQSFCGSKAPATKDCS